MTKITKLWCAAKSACAYCDEVVHFFDILKDRYASDQIMIIAEDEAQSLNHVQLNNTNVIMKGFF